MPSKNSYLSILEEDTFCDWIERSQKAKAFAFNTETDGLDTVTANLTGFAFAIAPGEAAYLPLAHNYLGAPEQLDFGSALERLKLLFEDEQILKIGQNLKFDIGVLERYGINLRGTTYDTMLESYVLNSVGGSHDIYHLAERYLGYKATTFEEIAGKGKNRMMFNEIALEQAVPYAAEDADLVLKLHLAMWPQLNQSSELLRVFNEIEMPMVPVLSHIEHIGVLIDPDILLAHSQELSKRIGELEMEAYNLASENFNLASPKQLQMILYEKQKLPILKKTPSGAPSTNEAVLSELAIDHPLPKVLLQHRCLSKLKTNYTDKLSIMINPNSNRLRTSYHQAVTATGRLSSRDPNLQNIPVRHEEGRRIRQAFIAPEGYVIVTADYSQIELRIMAHLSQDAALLKAFSEGKDIHCTTASEVFGIPIDKVVNEQRRSAKIINFGLIYGMSAFGLACQLGVPRSQASLYINHYFERYPGVRDYMTRIRNQASEQGYVTTLEGRRLYIPNAQSRNSMRRKAAERSAINAPMQGTAADIIKRAMIKIDAWIRAEERSLVRMIMQVHDELVFEIHESAVHASIQIVREIMEGAMDLKVPLKVDIGVGVNWNAAHA